MLGTLRAENKGILMNNCVLMMTIMMIMETRKYYNSARACPIEVLLSRYEQNLNLRGTPVRKEDEVSIFF